MRVQASGLQLRNIAQLAQTTTLEGVTVMGRLDAVTYKGDDYVLSLGGSLFRVPASHPVDIRRTANLDALVNGNDNTGEIADSLADDAVA